MVRLPMAPAVLSLLDEVTKTFRIDPERITLTGYGMGAAGAARIAAQQPDRFAAIGEGTVSTTST